MSEQQNTNNGKITKQRTQPPATATSTSNALVVPQLPTPSAAHNTIHAQFIDRTDALVINHDMNGRLLSTNNAVITTLGYHPTQLSQAYMVQLMPESEREYFRNEYLNQIKTDGKYEGRWLLNGRGGKPYHWLVYCNVITTAQQPIVICFAHDITALMNIEDALKMSNEIFRSAFDYSGMSLALISTGGIILDANKSLCSFLKYSKQELINKNN